MLRLRQGGLVTPGRRAGVAGLERGHSLVVVDAHAALGGRVAGGLETVEHAARFGVVTLLQEQEGEHRRVVDESGALATRLVRGNGGAQMRLRLLALTAAQRDAREQAERRAAHGFGTGLDEPPECRPRRIDFFGIDLRARGCQRIGIGISQLELPGARRRRCPRVHAYRVSGRRELQRIAMAAPALRRVRVAAQ
jgi:hypothetical protein